jgi:general secretion pathway protein C
MVAGIAYTIAQSVVFFIGQTNADSAVVHDSVTTAALPPVNIQAVMDRHLFGQADAQETTSTAAPSIETRLPLELQAVFVATKDDSESKAIIAEKGQTGHLYRVGADLPGGVQLVEVQGNFVVLSRAGSRERLTFPHLSTNLAAPLDLGYQDTLYVQDPASMNNPYESVIPEQVVESVPEPAPEAPPAQQIEEYQSRLESDPQATLEELGVAAVATDSAQGYRVGNLAQSPQLRQTGLQPGDVIVSVNGQAVGNVDSDRMELANVLAQGSARIEVQRGSRRFFVTTSLNQ